MQLICLNVYYFNCPVSKLKILLHLTINGLIICDYKITAFVFYYYLNNLVCVCVSPSLPAGINYPGIDYDRKFSTYRRRFGVVWWSPAHWVVLVDHQ